eukprot:6197715-Pleurochrysis_carterae.AAC.1
MPSAFLSSSSVQKAKQRAASQYANDVQDVGQGVHGKIKQAAHNSPVASLAIAGYVVAASPLRHTALLRKNVVTKVGPAEVGQEVLGQLVAQGGATRVCSDDVVNKAEHNHHFIAPDQVREAEVILGLGEGKRLQHCLGLLVSLFAVPVKMPGGEVAVHVANRGRGHTRIG